MLPIGKPEDFFDEIRTGKEELFAGHEEYRFNRFIQMAVHLRHLKFMFKFGYGSKPSNQAYRLGLSGQINNQSVESNDRSVGTIDQIFFDQLNSFFDTEQRFFGTILSDGHYHLIKDIKGSVDDIKMPVRNRIERSRIDANSHKSP